MDKSKLFLILTIIFWSATPAVATIALEEIDNYQLLSYSSLVGVVSLFLVVLSQGKISEISKLGSNDLLKMFGMGFVGIFLYYIFLFGSFSMAPAGQANFINYLWPIFIVILSIPILKEKFNFKTIGAVALSFFGALVVFTGGDLSSFNSEFTLGYILAALAAICYGLFSVFGKKLKYEKFSSMLVYYIFATILIIPTTFISSELVLPKETETILAIIYLGAIANSIAFVFWFKALAQGHTHKTANAIYSVPFLALIFTYFLNGEPISLAPIIGLTLIISGVIIQNKNSV